MDAFDQLREAYERLTKAQEHHMTLIRTAIRGEPYDHDELMASAKEVEVRHAEFMKAGERLIRFKR